MATSETGGVQAQAQAQATTITSDPTNSYEKYPAEGIQGQSYQYYPSATGSSAVSWPAHAADHSTATNAASQNLSYQYNHQPTSNGQDGTNASTFGSVSTAPTTDNASHVYSGYSTYPTSSNQYSHGSSDYTNYYSSYEQQPNQPYPQALGAYQNSGSPYQPISSFQNTGSHAGPTSYSSTYYNPGDYQTTGAYAGSSYSSQTNSWSQGNYATYAHQYATYGQDTSSAYSSNNAAPTANTNYEQHYKQWADYYNSQTEVTCAPGTENTVATSTAAASGPIPSVSSGYATPTGQPQPCYAQNWKTEPALSNLPSVQTGNSGGAYDDYWKHATQTFQNQHVSSVQSQFQKPVDVNSSYSGAQDQQTAGLPQYTSSEYNGAPQVQVPRSQYVGSSLVQVPSSQYAGAPQAQALNYQYAATPQVQGLSSQYASAPQVQHSYQQSLQPPPPPSADMHRVSKLQIPANPRITSHLSVGLPKSSKDTSTSNVTAKPAYVSVSVPQPIVLSSNAADSNLKHQHGMFPPSLRGYVERALARCKDEKQRAACQDIMKEMITKSTADGTLHLRDWDTEPLFPLPDACAIKNENIASPVASLSSFRRSPSRRTKSRWEPLPEEKPVEKSTPSYQDSSKHGSWGQFSGRDHKFIGGKTESNAIVSKFSTMEQNSSTRSAHRPVKRQRFGSDLSATVNGDASSDSDKEQGLTAYYSGAVALANSPEERKRRENRSKRFEKGSAQRADNHYRPKIGAGNYAKRASTLVVSKTLEDAGLRAVEDIDWDALTVKGTCQEIEKRYLRLTSAPDPSTVRPEEVLEKALLMVLNSEKNYLYKCDQLKSIRQDLTVQRIRNELTVKVYEAHARFALEYGDLAEFNQCQSQLKTLYAEGIAGCHMEFSAYHLLSVILHSNRRELLSLMSRFSDEAKKNEAVRHALSVRKAVTAGDFVLFFRLYRTAPNLSTSLMDLHVEKMRFEAVKCISRAYRPTVPVSYIARVLGFSSSAEDERSEEKDADGCEECTEWLKAHGACLVADTNGEMVLEAKASSSSLYIPEPEDAVAHGDANLAVNDFLARAPT